MVTREILQSAITEAAKGLDAVSEKAFVRNKEGLWQPRVRCLLEYYSSGEAMICGILLAFWFELYGSTSYVKRPKSLKSSLTDTVWLGAWYFMRITSTLSDRHAWKAINTLYASFAKQNF